MRKALAGKLIRLAYRIYPPRVTETIYHSRPDGTIRDKAGHIVGGWGGGGAHCPPERRVSRGWE